MLRYGSICSGIEAVTVAWHGLRHEGLTLSPSFFAEIDPYCCELLRQKYPNTPNLGDITSDDFLARAGACGPIDILVGGTPCQGFSSAGKRGGHNDPRSALSLAYVQIAEALRPKVILWENVPGVFTTNGGRDFGAFVGALADIGFNLAWRLLDARHFGVAQKRKRVFLVGYAGDEPVPDAVLFEPEGEGRDSQAGEEAGPGAAGTAANGPGAGRVVSSVTGDVSHCLKAEGADGSEDGTGRGVPVVAYEAAGPVIPVAQPSPVPFNVNATYSCAKKDHALQTETARCLDQSGGFASQQGGTVVAHPTADPVSTLQAAGSSGRGHRLDAESAAGGHLVVCVHGDSLGRSGEAVTPSPDAEGRVRLRPPGLGVAEGESYTLSATAPHAVAYVEESLSLEYRGRAGGSQIESMSEVSHCLRDGSSGGAAQRKVAYRLQSFGQYANDDVGSTLKSRDNQVGPRDPENPTNGDASETDAVTLLRTLRREVGEEAYSEWCLGALVAFQQAEVLRPGVHGCGVRCSSESVQGLVNGTLPCPEADAAGRLREVWEAFCSRCPPQGWRLPEQLADQLRAHLSELSRQGPSPARLLFDMWEAGEGIRVLREALPAVQEVGRPALSEARRTTYIVRRLTAREAERLQGFPDDYTLIPYPKGRQRLKPAQAEEVRLYLNSTTGRTWTEAEVKVLAADSHRYRALGNSMAVPVMRWLGERLLRVFALLRDGKPVPEAMP